MTYQETEAMISHQVVDRRLTGVSFVLNYIQLQFDPPPTVNALTPVAVRSAGLHSIQGEETFRNLLCDQVLKTVASVRLHQEEALTFEFVDGSEISVSLHPSDYVSAEAVNIYGKDHFGLVI